MADLLAREAMKEMDRKITNSPRPQRRSFQALEATDKFRFIERDREYCKLWHGMMDELMSQNGMSHEGFLKWLSDSGRVRDGESA